MAKNVRVEVRNPSNDKNRDLEILLKKFNRAVDKSGCLQNVKQREYYESRGRKNRRQKKKADITRQKALIKENFLNK